MLIQGNDMLSRWNIAGLDRDEPINECLIF